MLARVTVPTVWLVNPAPSRRSMLTEPVPALMVVPAACVIWATPASRLASTTPLAALSLAIRFRLPLLVEMLAFSSTERPACRVSVPGVTPPNPTMFRALDSVMSLWACSTTAVPLFNWVCRVNFGRVLVPEGVTE